MTNSKDKIRIHLTNIKGLGAIQLAESLLPAINSLPGLEIEKIYLQSNSNLKILIKDNEKIKYIIYNRILPNSLSRLFECTIFARKFNGESPLLVLGDLPLRCKNSQIVFVQTPNILISENEEIRGNKIKYYISRAIFRINIPRVTAFIVQTEVMRNSLELSYPSLAGRVHVISQPVPSWLLESKIRRSARMSSNSKELRLFYPAAYYPHKNHQIISRIDKLQNWPIEQLILTLEENVNPGRHLSWVKCKGLLSPKEIINEYSQVDGLLFLSKKESYGFPLLEAMFVGLPIVCPDRPYARIICGEQAIYFDPDEPKSLLIALLNLKRKLADGWWPDWSEQLMPIPKDWKDVARKMMNIVLN
jgi:glycosyltransferase involved in cell wall biosynthesis